MLRGRYVDSWRMIEMQIGARTVPPSYDEARVIELVGHSGTVLIRLVMNACAAYRYVAAPGSEIIVPSGGSFQAILTGAAGKPHGGVHAQLCGQQLRVVGQRFILPHHSVSIV